MGYEKCGLYSKLNTIEFINKANLIHNNKYDYSLVEYINSKTEIKIICPEHDDFKQTPRSHIYNKSGCPMCSGRLKTTKLFIKESCEIHGQIYDYSLVEYVNSTTNVKIICKKHGEFNLTPNGHLCGVGCPRCAGKNKDTECFIKESILVHGDIYDYSKSIYVGAKKNIKIICKKHGEFEQTPTNHLSGRGCNICKESKGEKIIREYLKMNEIEYQRNKSFDDCRDKYVLYFDFFISKHNLCIEFDGIQHYEINNFFGGVDCFNLQVKHDRIKTEYCFKNNIQLLRIKYDENILDKLLFLSDI